MEGVGGVDWYNGGNEHTTLHLLYSRFWHKFLFDLKLVPTAEPYMKRTSHGMILGEGGVKMSKSLGNVINPDDIVKTYGADTLRLYEMFMGPFDQSVAWSTESIIGARRFLEKVWRIGKKVASQTNADYTQNNTDEIRKRNTKKIQRQSAFSQRESASLFLNKLHKTIKKVEEDIEEMHFNTAISAMMILATEMESAFARGDSVTKEDFKKFLQILAPFAPHMTEELWQALTPLQPSPKGRGKLKPPPLGEVGGGLEEASITFSPWPKWDENLIKDEELKIVIQINGKVRDEMMVQADEKEEEIKIKALQSPIVLKYLAGKNSKRIIYVKNRLINIVV